MSSSVPKPESSGAGSHPARPVVLATKAADESLSRDEDRTQLLRLRKAAFAGLILWPLFGFADYQTMMAFNPAQVHWVLGIRFAGAAFVGFASCILRFGNPSPRQVRRLETATIGLLGSSVAVMGTFCGLESPYPFGIVVVMLARYTSQDGHWKQSILPLSIPVLSYPISVGVGALLSPEIREQLTSVRGSVQFNNNLSNLVGALVLLVAGGHAVWVLRRQIYAARNLGRYRLTRKLGAGGMGEVWAARHHALRREVAVKILRPEANGGNSVARFEREVRATSELTHSNTIRVFDYGSTEDGLWYYAMELLQGQNLGTLIRSAGPIPAARAVHLIIQASKALAEAHGLGLIHRDIKPENLYLTTLGGELDFVKVLDFGIVRFVDPTEDVLTHQGDVPGTPRYMAPEALGGAVPEARTDVYSLGAVLYFLMTGRHVFEQKSAIELFVAKRDLDPRPPSLFRLEGDIPPDLDAIVHRCLSRDPASRPASAEELALLLQNSSVGGKWTQQDARAAALVTPPVAPVEPASVGMEGDTMSGIRPVAPVLSNERTLTVQPRVKDP